MKVMCSVNIEPNLDGLAPYERTGAIEQHIHNRIIKMNGWCVKNCKKDFRFYWDRADFCDENDATLFKVFWLN